jgi:predicted metal-dependent TIM-barrel fold hydrolase
MTTYTDSHTHTHTHKQITDIKEKAELGMKLTVIVGHCPQDTESRGRSLDLLRRLSGPGQ